MTQTYCEHCKSYTDSIVACTKGGVICSNCKQIKEKDTKEYIKQQNINRNNKEKVQQAFKQESIKQSVAENKAKGVPCCPKCGSTAIHPVQKGFSLLTGFVGSGKTLNYCANCSHKWDPKKQ